MTFIILAVLLLTSYSSISATNVLCESPCTCTDNEEDNIFLLDCSRLELSIVPFVSEWPSNVTNLDLSTNFITDLEVELAHSTLRVLDLSHNRIHKVVQSAFAGLRSLKYLDLSGNGIRHLEDNGFYGLDQLKFLNLSSNSLEQLPDDIFYNFIGLQELSLADNPLTHLDPIHFNRMINLRRLDASKINAYSLDKKLFHTTGQLEFLDLSGNDFYEVPIDALRSAKRLRHLKLNENSISSLNRMSFAKLQTVEILEISESRQLKRVEEEAFSELTGLRILQLKHNRYLNFISPEAFTGLFNDTFLNLEELDLEGNQLQTLHQSMVPCARLRKFNIQQNPWICDCMLAWIKECEIQKIYLADLKCASPSRLTDVLIEYLNNNEFKCDYLNSEVAKEQMHHDRLVRSISVGLGVTMLVFISLTVALVFKWRDIKEWHRNRRKGPGAVYYVRARANPGNI